MSFNKQPGPETSGSGRGDAKRKTLLDLKHGEDGVIEHIDLPEDISRRLMEMGFLPGQSVTPGMSAPGGDPRVFRVDGSEVALRRETAARLYIRQETDIR